MNRIWRICAALFAMALALGALPARAAAPVPQAVAGRLQIAGDLQRPLPLDGEWGFAWHRFADPGWQQLPTGATAPVPAGWNELRADGKPPGENGWGSYVLQVDCPAGQALAVETPGERTASRVFVNGRLIADWGQPGADPGSSRGQVLTRIPISREFACPLRITVHLSNFAHRTGGFVRPILVGPADALAHRRETRTIAQTALLSTYALTGLVSLIFFAVRRRERLPLVFGLFCLAMGAYTDLIDERLLLRALPEAPSWIAYMRAEYLTWIAAMCGFFLTLRRLFPRIISARLQLPVLSALGLGAASVLALPPGVYSWLARPGQFVAVVVAAWLARALLRARGPQRADARVLLVGMLAVLASLAVDLLLIDSPWPDLKLAPFGFALFLLSPAVVIARRMSHALGAEERNRTLEENARLREDVERMSRHDLKTPLNSLLGAARLLGDDPSLRPDQRELVGVLQRAGWRMLEMVNLSLGLFKMETGAYEFRPEPVDLRAVALRVLADLQGYAEARAVRVRPLASEPQALWVRAEELLCYSLLANIVKNAVEATPPGGEVAIALEPGDPARLRVHNPGVVPPRIAARFFDKYVTSGKRGGAGLGTYSARLMAQVQGGDLALHTEATQGTTLTLSLRPLRGQPPAAPPPMPIAPPGPVRARTPAGAPARHVLLVDDDEFSRLVTSQLLPSPPCVVETASNGQAAIESMSARWPDDLLVDMEMPQMDGVATVRWLREQEAATPARARCRVLMLSGHDDAASIARALEAGADVFLTKPVSRERLLAAMELTGGEAVPT